MQAGSTDITGWTITGQSIDYLGPPWDVSDGVRAVDLDGRDAVFSGVSQSFATAAGKSYVVTFGQILREDVLPALRMNVSQAARELGVSRQLLHRILAGRAPVTPEMAVRLGKWAGNGPALWLGMQQAFDVWHAEQTLGPELDRIPGHAA